MNNLTNVNSKMKLLPISESPLLSIIITSYTKKRLKDLIDLINSINLQSYPNIETIIVLEKSEKLHCGIKLYLAERKGHHITVIFSSNELGISEARNLGIKNAKGDVIAFTDDDAILPPNWAEEIVKTFIENEAVVGLTGPAFPLWQHASLRYFPEEFYWIIGCSVGNKSELREVDYAAGVNMAFRKDVFDSCSFTNIYTKGAHEIGKLGPVGDDREFALNVRRKTRKRILYNSAVKVWHKVYRYRTSPKFIRTYAYWQGYSDAMFKRFFGDAKGRLKVEIAYLRKIVFHLFPAIAREFISNPVRAWKKIDITLNVQLYFCLGYLSFLFPYLQFLATRLMEKSSVSFSRQSDFSFKK